MIEFSEKQIAEFVNDTNNFRWAKKHYHEYDMYQRLEISHCHNDVWIIKGTICYGWYTSETDIFFNEHNEILSAKCNCPFDNSRHSCGHVGALLLLVDSLHMQLAPRFIGQLDFEKMNERMNKQQLFSTGSTKTDLFLAQLEKEFKIESEIIIDKARYQLFLELECTNYEAVDYDQNFVNNWAKHHYTIGMRVGTAKKNYVVKNLGNFLEAVANNEFVSYGKYLSFYHNSAVFDKESLKVIELIHLLISISDNYDIHGGRYLNINDYDIALIFNELYDCSAAFNYLLVKDFTKIALSVEKEDNYYLVDYFKDNDDVIAADGVYNINNSEHIVTKKAALNEAEVTALLEIAAKGLIVPEEKIKEFVGLMAGNDNFVFKNINEDKIIEELNPKRENSLKLLGDINDGVIVLKLIAEYDAEVERNALLKENRLYLSGKGLIAANIICAKANDINEETGAAYFYLDNDEALDFLTNGLNKLKAYTNVFISEKLKNFKYRNVYNLDVGVKINNNLLQVDFNVEDIDKEDLSKIMKKYKQKTKYYQLGNGSIINLENSNLEEVYQLMDGFDLKADELVNNEIELPLYRSFYLKQKIPQLTNASIELDSTFERFINSFDDLDIKKFKLTPRYDKILHDYQKYGVKWLLLLACYGFGGILADDMGLGKTLQTIVLLETIKNKDVARRPSIIVCPASLLFNWENEIEKFKAKLNVSCIYGTKRERKESIKQVANYDVIVTTYDYLRKDSALYQDYHFNYIILDEAQYIKNAKTKTANAVKQLQGTNRLALSGTPIENNLAELWSIFDFLMPGYLYSYGRFKKNIEIPIVKEQDPVKQELLMNLVKPFILRRRKKDVLTELPAKIEKVLKFNFNEEESKLYLAKLVEANKEVQQILDMKTPNKIMILKILNELRQICCDSRLLYDNVKHPSTKLSSCLEVIEALIQSKKKILLFSSYVSVLTLIQKELVKKNIAYYVITGSVSKVDRMEIVAEFQSDETPLLLISLKAGGTGLNLTAANAVIHFDPWWNLAAENQATDRAHRIGQTADVFVYKLIMKNSIEEKILKLQEKKKDLTDMFIENSQGSISQLSKQEIIDLFKTEL